MTGEGLILLCLVSSTVAVQLNMGQDFPSKAETEITLETSASWNFTSNNTDSVFRVKTWIAKTHNDSLLETPVFIIVRQSRVVESWQLPYYSSPRVAYYSKTHYMCEEALGELIIEASTFSQSNVTVYVVVDLVKDFNIRLEHVGEDNTTITGSSKVYDLTVRPTDEVHYKYKFEDGQKTALLSVTSNDTNCAVVSVQPPRCPVWNEPEDVEQGGSFQTFTESTAITLDREQYGEIQHVVFVVDYSDSYCEGSDTVITANDADRVKNIRFQVLSSPDSNLLLRWGVLTIIGCISPFYIIFFISCCCFSKRCRKAHSQENSTADAAESSNPEAGPSTGDQSPGDDSKLFIKAVRRKDKFAQFFWYTIIVGVFYGIPVLQLVILYQQRVINDGNQDLCYYNFQCARRVKIARVVIHNFNNVLSNVGYILLGILFLIVIYARSRYLTSREQYRKYPRGLPQHNGTYYALGSALIAEGVMSGCYHFCPNSQNFQFDTSFMFIMGGLMLIRMYQHRHPDSCVEAYIAFFSSAVIVLTVVLGILFKTIITWIVTSLAHFVCVVFVILRIYGVPLSDRAALSEFWKSRRQQCACLMEEVSGPYTELEPTDGMESANTALHPDPHEMHCKTACTLKLHCLRLCCVLVFSSLNTILLICGPVFDTPLASHVLNAILLNSGLYFLFYFYRKGGLRDLLLLNCLRSWTRCRCAAPADRPTYADTNCCAEDKDGCLGISCASEGDPQGGCVLDCDRPCCDCCADCCHSCTRVVWRKTFPRVKRQEKLRPYVWILFILVVALWPAALHFFNANLTEWSDTPAGSRVRNGPCIFLDYYDDHDVWHLLSAGALFISFVMILTMDDGLFETKRDEIERFDL